MNPYLIIAALAAILAAGAGGFKLGVDHEVAGQARAEKMVEDTAAVMAETAAKAIAKIRVNNTTIQNEVQREIQTNTVYRDCVHTPGGLLGINKALAPPGPSGDRKLPGSDAVSR